MTMNLKVTRDTIYVVISVLITPMLVTGCLCFSLFAQQPLSKQDANQSANERVHRLLETLEKDSTLWVALERGDRGDNIYRQWMNKMQQHGVRQASFRIKFSWGKQSKDLKITDIKYLQEYYHFDTAISDALILNQIRAGELEQELSTEVLNRAKVNLNRRLRDLNANQICGTLYLNLLDDEVLPILDDMPDVSDECESVCKT